MEEIARQAGWAKTFGLPLELISAGGGAGALPADVDRRRARRRLPADGRLHRPEPADVRARRGRAAARRRGQHATRASRGSASSAVASPASRPTGARSRPRSSSTPAACSRREIGALAGVTVPLVPMAHEYLVLEPSGLPLDMPTMRDPSLLVYFRPESGGLIMGGYERHCAPWSLDGIPPDFNGKLLEEDWPRFEELMENAIVRVPSLEEMEVVQADQRPGGVHARRRVHPRAVRRARLLGRGGLLRARARRRRRDGQARRRVDRRGHAVARRLAHGLAPLRRRLPLARLHARAHEGDLRDVLRRQVPGARAAGRAAAAASPRRTRGCATLGAAFGEKSGWERANWFEPNAAARRRVAPAARLGRASSGRPRSARSTAPAARRRRSSTSRRSRSSTSSGEGAPEFLERLCGEPRRARGRARHVHADAQRARRDRVRLHRHAARARTGSGSSPARRSASTTPPGSASTRPTTGRCASPT